ncbi:hypothetical protein PP1Y_AT26837 [Novosphingobium sp. PP1Y]|nr:hypothetical protein PP1Y_AT26837 [Novosphingobium sp. PP1Y]
MREGTGRDDSAPDRDAGQAIVGMEGDRARGRFGAAHELRTGVLAIARIGRRGQLVLVDLGSFADLGHRNDHRRAVCDADRQRRSRDIAITVCHLISEDIGSAAAGSRSAHIAVGTIGEQRERAELAGHDRSGARKRAGSSGMHAGDAAAIGAEGIGARRTAGGALAAQDIAGLRGEVRGRDRVGIRAGNRSVVSDIDSQRGRGGIAIGIGDHDREHVRRVVATGIVGKLVSVGNLVVVECTQCQATISAIDLLASLPREDFAIDDNGADAIFRSDEDRAGGDVRPVSELRAGRFLIAVETIAGKTGFRNRIGSRVRRRTAVLDQDIGHLVHQLGKNFLLLWLREREFGVGKQVAQAVRGLDRSGRIGKVAARALQRAGGRLRLVAGKQRREVEWRHRDIADDDLWNIDGAIGNDEDPAIGKRENEVAALHRQFVERSALGQNDEIVGIGQQDLRRPRRRGCQGIATCQVGICRRHVVRTVTVLKIHNHFPVACWPRQDTATQLGSKWSGGGFRTQRD